MGFDGSFHELPTGRPVTASLVNRSLRELSGNVLYLWELIQAASLGSTLYARQQTVEADALVGMPVFYNPETARYERAIAALNSGVDGLLVPALSSQPWGIIATKTNSTLADILLSGIATIDISLAVNGDVEAGMYYLSGSTAGHLVTQRQPVSVSVLRTDGAGQVFVLPQFVDLVDRHVHYKFALTCAPAGTHVPPEVGERHEITDADAELPGWLPADDASFDGLAPEGAMFGYNIAADSALAAAWPPLPASEAYLEWDRGLDQEQGFNGVPVGALALVLINSDGIWWMSNCYDDVPWPTTLDTTDTASVSVGIDQCPRVLVMAMNIWFTRPNFATETTLVRSLRSLSDHLLVRCRNTSTEAAVGDLTIDLDLDFTTTDDDAEGSLAVKEQTGATFKRGPIVEGLLAGSDNVTLAGTRTLATDDGELQQGRVTISVNPSPTTEIDISLVALDGATEETYVGIPYIGLPKELSTGYRGKICIPYDMPITDPQMAIRLRILGRAAGALPALTLSMRRVPRPSDDEPILDLPLLVSEEAVTIDTEVTLAAANQYIEATSEAFAVVAGDIVFFSVERSDSDEYAAEVGILQSVGVLSASS